MLSNLTHKGFISTVCLRCSSQFARYNDRSETKNHSCQKHVYKQLYPWKTRQEFAELLKQNIVYNEDGLIAINKPYGVPVHNKDHERGREIMAKIRARTSLPDAPHSLDDALEPLASALGVKWLRIVKSTEKYSSGITLLVSDKETEAKVMKSIAKAKPASLPFLVYWVMTVGYPNPPVAKEKVALELQYIGDSDEKEPQILFEYSRKKVKAGKIQPVLVEYQTLAVDRQLSVSLMEIAATTVKWHFLRVYAARKTACILGDPMYSSRVRQILGKRITMGPQHIAAYNAQPLPDGLCKALNLPVGTTTHEEVPVMIHLRSFVLKNYFKEKDLVLTAPLSPHFNWTCQAVGWLPTQFS